MITTAVVVLAAMGATYSIEWDYESYHLTGVVDTEADTLTWDALPDDWTGESLVWPAVTHGERIPGGEIHYEIVPYDVPDDWSGVLGDWGFISDAKTQVTRVTGYAGLGCGKYQWTCLSSGYCFGQMLKFGEVAGPKYTIAHMNAVDGSINVYGKLGPARVNLTPVSPTRIVGDANFDGLFDSSDLVQVFAIGKYETGAEAWWTEGDWDQNGLFDSGDLVAAFAAGDYERPVAAVPEPSAALLLVVAMFLCRRMAPNH